MTDWYKIKRILIWQNNVEKQIYPAQTVQTFDFQNDWDLGWTGSGSWNNWTPAYSTWQGWYIYRSSQYNDWYFYPPQTIFNNKTLKKVRIWMYKGIATTNKGWVWTWICNTAWNVYALWSYVWYDNDRITLNWTRINTINVTWEVLFVLDFSDINVKFSINWTEYTSSIASSGYTDLWSNWTFALEVANWIGWRSDVYLRKAEITTV